MSPDVKTAVSKDVHANPVIDWLTTSKMSDVLCSLDCLQTPSVARSAWQQSLQICLSTCLTSQFLMFVYSRLKRIQFNNDAKRLIVRVKRLKRFGQRFENGYAEFTCGLIALFEMITIAEQFYFPLPKFWQEER